MIMRTIIYTALCLGLFLLAPPAQALITSWTNPSGGLWSNPANWSAGIPGVNDSARIVLNGTYTVDGNIPAQFRHLVLGGTSGTQTLQINQPFSIGLSFAPCTITAHGVLDVQDSLAAIGQWGQAVSNMGTLLVRNGGQIRFPGSTGGVSNETFESVIRLYDGAILGTTPTLNINRGTLEIFDTVSVLSSIEQDTGIVRVDGHFSVDFIRIWQGALDLQPGSTINLLGTNPGSGGISVEWMGSILMGGGTTITSSDSGARIGNLGSLSVTADSVGPLSQAHINVNLRQYSSSSLSLNRGNLLVSRPAEIYSVASIAARCTLAVDGSMVMDSNAVIAGSGTIHVLTGGGNWFAHCPFTGSLLLSGTPAVPATVTLVDPEISPHLRKLALYTPHATFITPADPPITVDTLIQQGGTIIGSVNPLVTCAWTEGTITTDFQGDIVIPPGSNLVVSGDGEKFLDSLALIIEGTATMQGGGVFTLVDTAQITVATSGVLDVGPGFTLTGLGSLVNNGWTRFDPQDDTVAIRVPLRNETVVRTPGTIDILSRPVVIDSGLANIDGFNIGAGGEVIVDWIENRGTFTVFEGGQVTVRDTLLIFGNGGTILQGGSLIAGSGLLLNGGNLIAQGDQLRTPTNVVCQPQLENLPDSGYIHVVADTLTLLSGGVNRGLIRIETGAVLKVFGPFTNDLSGVITGGGVLDVSAALFVNNGTLSPGSSPGLLTIAGSMECGPSSVLQMEIGGPGMGTGYDRLTIQGSTALSGTLALSLVNSFVPTLTDSLNLLGYHTFSGAIPTVSGTRVGNGQFLEFALGPIGLVSYICNGVSDLAITPLSVADTLDPAVASRDTFLYELCNVGHCPLDYRVSVTLVNPPSPAWITVVAGDQTGLLTRTECQPLRLAVDVTGLAPGQYQATLSVASNDPSEPEVTIPVEFTVLSYVQSWDVGGGHNDFADLNQAAGYLAAATIQIPQLFNVYPGTYQGPLTINRAVGASAVNTVTFHGVPTQGQNPQLVYGGAGAALTINSVDHLTWDAIDVRRTGGNYSMISVVNSADSVTIRNLTLSRVDSNNHSTDMIYVPGTYQERDLCDGLLIENVTFYRPWRAVQLGGGAGGVRSGRFNEIRHCKIIDCNFFGFLIGSQNQLRVHHNRIQLGWGNSIAGISATAGYAGDTMYVYDNYVSASGTVDKAVGIGVSAPAGGVVYVYNNMISLGQTVQDSTTAIMTSSALQCFIYHNSIRLTNHLSRVAVTLGVRLRTGATAVLANNILSSDGTNDPTWLIHKPDATVQLVSDYNGFYHTGTPTSRVGLWNGAAYSTLADWTAGTGHDTHSLFGTPGFASDTDLHIDGYYYTCDSTGTPLPAVTTDMDGEPRDPLHPDLGADEFSGLRTRLDDVVAQRFGSSMDVRLDWQPVTGAVSYRVYGSTSPDLTLATATLLGVTASTSYTDVNALLRPDLRYYYVVRPSTLTAPALPQGGNQPH